MESLPSPLYSDCSILSCTCNGFLVRSSTTFCARKHPTRTLMRFAASDTTSSGATSSTSSSQDSWPSSHGLPCPNLVPEDDDPLIPSFVDVSRTFFEGKNTWAFFLEKAHDYAPGFWPVDTVNPYITLSDVPALPSSLPHTEFLSGRPMWQMSGCEAGQHDMWSSQLVPGRRLDMLLRVYKASRCDFILEPASCYLGVKPKVTNCLAILTICWSYILSVRLLELQGRKVWYTRNHIRLRNTQGRDTAAICLNGASPALVRWLSGILCSDFGWRTEGEGLPPWAIVPSVDVVLYTTHMPPAVIESEPPNSDEATTLLVELCRLFSLGVDSDGDECESLPAYRAAFLASLMIPYYKETRLRPQFPVPRLELPPNCSLDARSEADILQYAADLRYFMTLSMHPPSLGSVMWSIFWQPDVQCHLVSPWLKSALITLEPTLEDLQLEILVKTFASRRPTAALWWLALFLLGDLSAVSWIRRYANKLEEQYGCASLSSPDPIFAAWTGTKQSFFDQNSVSASESPETVSRADLLRFRFNFKLQENSAATLAWRPFGFVNKSDVEVDLWPCLEARCLRSYHSFVWYTRLGETDQFGSGEGENCRDLEEAETPDTTLGSAGVIPSSGSNDFSFGFRQDTKRSIKVRDDLELHGSIERPCLTCPLETKLAPSRICTLQMLSLSVQDAAGTRHTGHAVMPNVLEHQWLEAWGGLRTFETLAPLSCNTSKAVPQSLLEWLENVEEEPGVSS